MIRITITDAAFEAMHQQGGAGTVRPLNRLGPWSRCKSAGVQFSAHGLRKTAAARFVDMGRTKAEL
jgi:hypothetical protein